MNEIDARPAPFVRTCPAAASAPSAESVSRTYGSGLPSAERTRIVAVVSCPTVSAPGRLVSTR